VAAADREKQFSDAELVRRTLSDAANFAFLVERYEAKLMRYICRFTAGERQLAEDIFQEAMIKVYRNLNGYNPNWPFSAWIYRIVRNEALNQLRRRRLQNTISLDGEEDGSASLFQVLTDGEDLAEDAVRRETAQRVRELLGKLRPDYREVLVLRYLEERDYNEISFILQKPLGTVGVLLKRAKSAFRQLALKYNLLNHE
jgi:RNA polymerase sigma-70 factor (ECF subfamily)